MRNEGYAIGIEGGGKYRGLLVDEIKRIQEIVVKGLDPIFGSPPGISASTVRADGRPILILDPRSLVEIEPFASAAT